MIDRDMSINEPTFRGSEPSCVDSRLQFMKPLLKKQTVHNNRNVILTLKSIEILLIDSKNKFLSPIYVPIRQLESLMTNDKSNLEVNILKCIKMVGNSFTFDETSINTSQKVIKVTLKESKLQVRPKKSRLRQRLSMNMSYNEISPEEKHTRLTTQ